MAPARLRGGLPAARIGQFRHRTEGNRAVERLIAVQYDAIVTRRPKAQKKRRHVAAPALVAAVMGTTGGALAE